MKKLFLILIPILFIGCTKTVYVDISTGYKTDIKAQEITIKDFFNLEAICQEGSCKVLIDKNSDILYYYENCYYLNAESRAITPIMKADGTCLTYTEWKANRNN